MGLSQTTLAANGAQVIFRLDGDVVEDVYVQIVGPFAGTLTPTLSVDGVTYDPVQLVPINGTGAVLTVTAPGSFRTVYGQTYGAQFFKIVMSPYTSGSATVLIKAMAAGR
jgi:hypothetical protein